MSTTLIPDVFAEVIVKCQQRHGYHVRLRDIEQVWMVNDEIFATGQATSCLSACKLCGTRLEITGVKVDVELIPEG